jgi:hypothetical protein
MVNGKLTDTGKSYLVLALVSIVMLNVMSRILRSHVIWGGRSYELLNCGIAYILFVYFFVRRQVKVKTERIYKEAFQKANESVTLTAAFPVQVTDELKLYCVALKETRMFYDTSWTIVGEHKGELFSVEIIRQDSETLETMLDTLKNTTEPTDITALDKRNQIFYD